MIERQRYVVLASICSFLLMVAAWRVLTLGLADHFSRKDPDRALSWRPDHPVALIQAAERATSAGKNPDRASKLAHAALRANPKEGRAYRVLGQLAERRGDQQRAVALFEIATRYSPRDVPTHAWLERHYLRLGQVVEALRHADLLLRVRPRMAERQFPVLMALAALPQGQVQLAQLLSTDPPWRPGFIAYLCQKAPDSAAIAPVIALLRASPEGLGEGELSAWIDRLNRDRRWGEAYMTWVAALPRDQQDELGNVFNGGFEREPSNFGFDWRIGNAPGAFIERLPVFGAGGNLALRVSFEEGRIPFNHVRQLLALPPGRYRLQGRARADGLRSERGLVWDISCAEDSKSLAATDPLMGISSWRPFSVSFDVPIDNCGGQWLQLSVPARIRAEQRIGGRAWFDDLRIVRGR